MKEIIFNEGSLSNINRCFLLGNGPSISKFNLDSLKNEFTIGTNRILYTGFTPNILAISDKRCLDKKNLDLINKSSCYLIITEDVKDYIFKNLNIDKKRIIKSNNLIFPPQIHEYNSIYNQNFDTTMCMHSVIGDLAIPAAIYLGIKNIFLIGVDSYWNINTVNQSHFYEADKEYKDLALHHALYVKMEMNMFFAKLQMLAQMKAFNIFNLSPGSAVQAFPKMNPENILPNLIHHKFSDILDKFIVIFDKIFISIKGLANYENSFTFIDIERKEYLRHYKGELITSNKTLNEETFYEDATFFVESSFINEQKISLRSVNLNLYVVKYPYFDKYKIQDINSDFDIEKSSFNIHSNISEAMLEANSYINRKTKYNYDSINKFNQLSVEVKKMIYKSKENEDSKVTSIKERILHQKNIFKKFNLDYDKGIYITEEFFLKHNINKPPMYSEHYIVFAALSQLPFEIKNILEIGTYNGDFTFFLSHIFEKSKIITMDIPSTHKLFKESYNRNNEIKLSSFIEHRNKILSRDNIAFIEKDSFMIPSLNLEKFDIIWIDGCHDMPDVCYDICNSYHLLKNNGFLLCDDVYMSDDLTNKTSSYLTFEKIRKYGRLDTKYLLKRISDSFYVDPQKRKYIAIAQKKEIDK